MSLFQKIFLLLIPVANRHVYISCTTEKQFNMIKKLLLILILFQLVSSSDLSVDTVYRQCFDFSEPCAIPVIRSSDTLNQYIVDRINAAIEDRYMMSPIDTSEECRWTGLEFDSEFRGKYLWINWFGVYYGAYDNSIREVFLFRTDNGDCLTGRADVPDFPIELFFKPKSFSLIFPEWKDSCVSQMEDALKCADGLKPYCSCMSPNLELTDTTINARLDYDCYPRVARGCDPYLSIVKPLSSIDSLLSPLGKYVLHETNYLSIKPFERFLLYQNHIDSLLNIGVEFNTDSVDLFYDFDGNRDY